MLKNEDQQNGKALSYMRLNTTRALQLEDKTSDRRAIDVSVTEKQEGKRTWSRKCQETNRGSTGSFCWLYCFPVTLGHCRRQNVGLNRLFDQIQSISCGILKAMLLTLVGHNSSVWLPGCKPVHRGGQQWGAKEGQIRIVCFKAETHDFRGALLVSAERQIWIMNPMMNLTSDMKNVWAIFPCLSCMLVKDCFALFFF